MDARGKRKVQIAQVVSNKMDKTAVVAVTTTYRHPLYKKIIKRTKKYYAHDEDNKCQPGQRVEIMETRPLSRLKRWRVTRVIEVKKDDSSSN